MLRKCVSISLGVSFFALSISGMLMIVLNSFTFQLQMHPVHKIFGVLMVVSGCFHLSFNWKPIKAYLKNRKILILGTFLSLMLVVLFVIGMNKPLNKETATQIEQLMMQMEAK